MKRAILPLVFAVTAIAITANAKFYQVFRTDNEHCFALDADHEIYRIDDVDFKCGKDAEKMQPNPDKLFKIKKTDNVGEIVPVSERFTNARKNLSMGNQAMLSGVDKYTYLYKTAKGEKNGETIFEYYFVKSNNPSSAEGKTDISVGALSYENYGTWDDGSTRYRPALGRNYLNFRFDKLDKLPPEIQAYPLKIDDPIVAREIPVYTADGKPSGRVETASEPSLVSVEVFVPQMKPEPVASQPVAPTVVTKTKTVNCPQVLKRHGRKFSDINCEKILQDENFIRECLLLKVCDTASKGCDSRKCVAQYKEMGGLDDVVPLMERLKRAKIELSRAENSFKQAEKAAADCDDTDKDAAIKKAKKEKVVAARKVLVKAKAAYHQARERLDHVVQTIYKHTESRYSCMANNDAVFKYFNESWTEILDFDSRFWECSLGLNSDPFKSPSGGVAADRGPSATKKKKNKKK